MRESARRLPHGTLRLLLGLAGALPAAHLMVTAVQAQVVELQVREESTLAAVPGAIVRLLADGAAVAQGLTNEGGRVVLRLNGPGTFRIKVDRIGWTGVLTSPIAVGPGEILRREVLMPATRMELPGVEVRGRTQCERQGQGGPLAVALWEEIQKALTASVISQRQARTALHVRHFTRELSRTGQAQREWVNASQIQYGKVFTTQPPQLLARAGFVQQDRHDSVTYAAPDAALLLSDEFVALHCFLAVEGAGPLVGLAFEPIPGRKVPDVKGTLWVDRSTSELKFIEFAYTGLPGILAKADLGGRVEFQRFRSGDWVAAYWHVRTPWLELSEFRSGGGIRETPRLIGYRDLGGRVSLAVDALGRVDRAIVMGRVYDSTQAAGMAGVVVKIEGSTDSVLTDGAGNFELAALVSGDQRITARHPKLGLLGGPTTRPVLLSIGDTTRADFAVPSLPAIVKALCGNTRNRTGVVGMVFDEDGRPAEGMNISVQWRTPSGGFAEHYDRSGKGGIFALCSLPADRGLPVRAKAGKSTLAEVPVQLEWGVFRWLDLRVPRHNPQ